jgi:hypothetical protein
MKNVTKRTDRYMKKNQICPLTLDSYSFFRCLALVFNLIYVTRCSKWRERKQISVFCGNLILKYLRMKHSQLGVIRNTAPSK